MKTVPPRMCRDCPCRDILRWALMTLTLLSTLMSASPALALPASGTNLAAPVVSESMLPYGAVRSQQGCTDLVQNGGFEQDGAWERPRTAIQAQYVGQGGFPQGGAPHGGQRAMRLGTITPNSHASYSSIRQRIHVPATAKVVTLEFWVWMFSQDTDGGDRQEAYLLNPRTGRIMMRIWRVDPAQNAPNWQLIRADLTPYRGEEVILYFNVYNDGDDKPSALFLDDVRALACSAPTPTPTFTPLPPTPTPVPPTAPATGPTPTLASKPVKFTPTPTPLGQPAARPAAPTATPTVQALPSPTPTPAAEKTRFGINRQMLLIILYTLGFTLAFVIVAVWLARLLRKRFSGRS